MSYVEFIDIDKSYSYILYHRYTVEVRAFEHHAAHALGEAHGLLRALVLRSDNDNDNDNDNNNNNIIDNYIYIYI